MSDRQVATTEDIVWFHFIRIVHINTVVFTGYAGASSGTVAGCTGAVAFQAVLADWVDVISLVTFIGAQISLPAEKRKMTMKAHNNSPALLKNGVWIIRHCSSSSSNFIPKIIQQYNRVCMTNITNNRVIIDIVMWFCWWPPEKPWAYQAGSHIVWGNSFRKKNMPRFMQWALCRVMICLALEVFNLQCTIFPNPDKSL